MKNELATGVMPSKYFGVNAAWLRMAVIAYNVLKALKRLALPTELLAARPKRLRCLILNTAGRLVHHARRVVLRLAPRAERLREWLEAMRLLPVRVGIVFGNSLSTDLETSFWREAGGSVFLIGK